MKQMVAVVGVVKRKVKNRTEILICQRICPLCQEADNKWELPGGKVEKNETLFKAVEREVLEETGITCSAIKLLQTHTHKTWNFKDEKRVVLAFGVICKYLYGNIICGNKVKKPQWLLIKDALKLDLLYGIKEKIIEATDKTNKFLL